MKVMMMMDSLRAIALSLFVVGALIQECCGQTCQDTWSTDVCNDIKNDDYFGLDTGNCFMYSDVCTETCGCSYDPTADEVEYGIDPSFYEADDFQCVYEDAWKDFQKYNCTLYEGAGWCELDDNGDITEGSGWCHAVGPEADNCSIPEADKWSRMPYAANDDGLWAKSCCCDSGIADTYPYEEDSPGYGGDCIDKFGASGKIWTDTNAYSCRSYHFGSYCTLAGDYGSGWNVTKFGTFDYYDFDGWGPLQACCSCGGGSNYVPPEDDGWCFSGNMEVVVQGKGVVPMAALQVGDYVKIGKGEVYEKVYAFGHRVPHKYTEFVQLHTNAGSPLEITSEHLVFVDGKTNPVRAGSIRVGDVLQAEGNNAVVQNVEAVTRNGIYSPLTSSGSIQVNGVTASTYISFQKENKEYVELQGGIEIPMSHHDFAHRAMAPFRFYCTTLAICDANDANSGLPFYVSKGMELVVWSKHQGIAIQFSLWVAFRILILASILMTCAVFMIPAYLISGKLIYQLQRMVHVVSCVHFKQEMKMKKDI